MKERGTHGPKSLHTQSHRESQGRHRQTDTHTQAGGQEAGGQAAGRQGRRAGTDRQMHTHRQAGRRAGGQAGAGSARLGGGGGAPNPQTSYTHTGQGR